MLEQELWSLIFRQKEKLKPKSGRTGDHKIFLGDEVLRYSDINKVKEE